MPQKAPRLPDDALENIARWIDLGAPYDRPLVEKGVATRRAGPTDADRDFWSFRPLHAHAPPAVKDGARALTPVDRFILARLDAKGLTQNPRADRRALVRRVTFDLTGLPPTPGEMRPMTPPAPRGWSSGCSPRPGTASVGHGTGWTWPGSPSRTGTSRITTGRTPSIIEIS